MQSVERTSLLSKPWIRISVTGLIPKIGAGLGGGLKVKHPALMNDGSDHDIKHERFDNHDNLDQLPYFFYIHGSIEKCIVNKPKESRYTVFASQYNVVSFGTLLRNDAHLFT